MIAAIRRLLLAEEAAHDSTRERERASRRLHEAVAASVRCAMEARDQGRIRVVVSMEDDEESLGTIGAAP